MSEVCVATDRFWREFKPDVAGSLSDSQRGEIERVLCLAPAAVDTPADDKVGDLRLSFKWFFLRLAWGPEKRSRERVENEQKAHPVMSRRNAPVLASLFAGYMALWYVGVGIAMALAAYFLI